MYYILAVIALAVAFALIQFLYRAYLLNKTIEAHRQELQQNAFKHWTTKTVEWLEKEGGSVLMTRYPAEDLAIYAGLPQDKMRRVFQVLEAEGRVTIGQPGDPFETTNEGYRVTLTKEA